ncbi:hypothetical protein M758_UG105000, partial [Ceratodon purpureus]
TGGAGDIGRCSGFLRAVARAHTEACSETQIPGQTIGTPRFGDTEGVGGGVRADSGNVGGRAHPEACPETQIACQATGNAGRGGR